jgi:hypothetical protein
LGKLDNTLHIDKNQKNVKTISMGKKTKTKTKKGKENTKQNKETQRK